MHTAHTPMHFDLWSRRRALAARKRRGPMTVPPPAGKAWIQRIEHVPGVRVEKVQAIREALVAGSYDLESKFESILALFDQDPPPKPAA